MSMPVAICLGWPRQFSVPGCPLLHTQLTKILAKTFFMLMFYILILKSERLAARALDLVHSIPLQSFIIFFKKLILLSDDASE